MAVRPIDALQPHGAAPDEPGEPTTPPRRLGSADGESLDDPLGRPVRPFFDLKLCEVVENSPCFALSIC